MSSVGRLVLSKWGVSRTAWAIAVVTAAAALIVAIAKVLSDDKLSALPVVLFVLGGIFSAAVPLLNARAKHEEYDATARASMHPPEPIGGIDPYSRLGLERSPRERPSTYIPRRPYDEQLDTALKTRRLVVLVAPTGWGKSRTAYEAAKRIDPTGAALVVVPSSSDGLRALLALEPPWQPESGADRPWILWLDDLHRHLKDDVPDAAALRRLLERPDEGMAPVVVISTLSSEERGRLRGLRPALDDGAVVEPGDVTADEQAAAAEVHPGGDFTRGIGPWFLAPVRLLEAYRESDHVVGRRLVETAVDWRRSGMEGAVPRATLRSLTLALIDGHVREEVIQHELDWATAVVPGANWPLLIEESDELVNADDLVVAFDEGRESGRRRPIPQATWHALIDLASPTQAARMAQVASARLREAADLAERGTLAEACEAAAGKAAAAGVADGEHVLGILRYTDGSHSEAKELWARAAAEGHPGAANDLGYLLVNEDHPSDADRAKAQEDARSAYLVAYAKGHSVAANNLAALVADDGDLPNAEFLFREADRRGYVPALGNLGVLLERQGRLEEAERAYRSSAERGAIAAMISLASLLEGKGDLAASERWYREAARTGDDDARVAFGTLLARRGALEEAKAEWQAAADHGHPGALVRLAEVARSGGAPADADAYLQQITEPLQQALASLESSVETAVRRSALEAAALHFSYGEFVEAESSLREAARGGDPESLFSLGFVLEEMGRDDDAKVAYESAAQAGWMDARARLGAMLIKQKRDRDRAAQLIQQAADGGSAEGCYQLGRLRQEQGLWAEADDLYRRAGRSHPGAARALVGLPTATEDDRRAADEAAFREGSRLARQKRDAEAEHLLRAAVERGHAGAMSELSMLLARRGDSQEAGRLHREAARLGDRNAVLVDELTAAIASKLAR